MVLISPRQPLHGLSTFVVKPEHWAGVEPLLAAALNAANVPR